MNASDLQHLIFVIIQNIKLTNESISWFCCFVKYSKAMRVIIFVFYTASIFHEPNRSTISRNSESIGYFIQVVFYSYVVSCTLGNRVSYPSHAGLSLDRIKTGF